MERVMEFVTPGVKFLVRPEKQGSAKCKVLNARTYLIKVPQINSELTHDICR
jgi:hypothetical protein